MKYLVGNIKMNLINLSDRQHYLKLLKDKLTRRKFKSLKIIVCSPAVYLENFVNNLAKSGIEVGAQDFFWEKEGSFTGLVSAWMIKNLGVNYSLVGHSECRRYSGETNLTANLKIKSALKAGLKVFYCVGENQQEKEADLVREALTTQVTEGLRGISSAQLEKIIIAYEPVWSIGTDIVPSSNEIMQARIIIQKILSSLYGLKQSLKMPILYGGSVKVKNVLELYQAPQMQGVLVGRQSLRPSEFLKIAEKLEDSPL